MKFHQMTRVDPSSGVKMLKTSRDKCIFLTFSESQAKRGSAGRRLLFDGAGAEHGDDIFEFAISKSIKKVWALKGFRDFQGRFNKAFFRRGPLQN